MAVEVRPLRPEDDRRTFTSGHPELDRFFRDYAGQNQFKHHLGVTYVAVGSDRRILGYATVAPADIEIENLAKALRKRLPRYPLPVLRLARMAVDRSAQRTGIGRALLRAMFAIAHELARRVGCVGVVVDAKPAAIDYYRKFGFEPFSVIEGALSARPEPIPMFLPLGSIPKQT